MALGIRTAILCALLVMVGGGALAFAGEPRSRVERDAALKARMRELREQLKDSNSAVRSSAVLALGLIGDKDAIPILKALLKDSDENVRISAVTTLGAIGGKDTISALIETFKGKDSIMRYYAAEALGRIGDKDAIPVLIEAIKNREWGVQQEAVRSLAQIGKDAVPALIEVLKVKDLRIRRNASKALGLIGDKDAVPALIEAIKDKDWTTRYDAAKALGQIGNEDAVPMLIEAIKDPTISSEIRAELEDAKKQIESPAIESPAEEKITGKLTQIQYSLLKQDSAASLNILKTKTDLVSENSGLSFSSAIRYLAAKGNPLATSYFFALARMNCSEGSNLVPRKTQYMECLFEKDGTWDLIQFENKKTNMGKDPVPGFLEASSREQMISSLALGQESDPLIELIGLAKKQGDHRLKLLELRRMAAGTLGAFHPGAHVAGSQVSPEITARAKATALKLLKDPDSIIRELAWMSYGELAPDEAADLALQSLLGNKNLDLPFESRFCTALKSPSTWNNKAFIEKYYPGQTKDALPACFDEILAQKDGPFYQTKKPSKEIAQSWLKLSRDHLDSKKINVISAAELSAHIHMRTQMITKDPLETQRALRDALDDKGVWRLIQNRKFVLDDDKDMSRERTQIKSVLTSFKKEWPDAEKLLSGFKKEQLQVLQDVLEENEIAFKADNQADVSQKYRDWLKKKMSDYRAQSKALIEQENALETTADKAKSSYDYLQRIFDEEKHKPKGYDEAKKAYDEAFQANEKFRKANKEHFAEQDEMRELQRNLVVYEALVEAMNEQEPKLLREHDDECLARARTGVNLPDGFDRAMCEAQSRSSERLNKDGPSGTGEQRKGVGSAIKGEKGL